MVRYRLWVQICLDLIPKSQHCFSIYGLREITYFLCLVFLIYQIGETIPPIFIGLFKYVKICQPS